MNYYTKKLWDSQLIMDGMLASIAATVDLKLKETHDSVGTKPSILPEEFDAPTLWGSVGNIADQVIGLPEMSDTKIQMMSRRCD